MHEQVTTHSYIYIYTYVYIYISIDVCVCMSYMNRYTWICVDMYPFRLIPCAMPILVEHSSSGALPGNPAEDKDNYKRGAIEGGAIWYGI